MESSSLAPEGKLGFGSSVYGKLLRLPDWHFVFGLPTTEREYKSASWRGEFVSHPCIAIFSDYCRVILDPFERLIGGLARNGGLHVTRYPKSSQFAARLTGEAAVMLFTHCSDDRLEFADGMVGFDEIIRRVPKDFSGIIDLVACDPAGFPGKLRAHAPRAGIRWVPLSLTPEDWLLYCASFLARFNPGPTRYMDATVLTAATFVSDLTCQV